MKQLQDDVDALLLQEEETMNELMMQISSSSGLPNGQGGNTGGERVMVPINPLGSSFLVTFLFLPSPGILQERTGVPPMTPLKENP